MPPLVSVILPTYNRAPLLARAIASVRAQTYGRWELVIVDDGSTDETDAVLAECVASDSRTRAVRQQNAGPGAARNRGLLESRGDFIAYLDSDDEYDATHLETRVRFLLAHPEIDFLHGGLRLASGDDDATVPDARDPSRSISIRDCAVGGTFFARRAVLELSGGWPGGYAEDAALLEAIRGFAHVCRVDIPTYVYHRETADSRCTEQGSRRGTV